MRDYQTKSNQGGAADSITATKFGAGEFNSLATENENAVSRAGLTLAPANGSGEVTTQLAQSLFLHSVKSQSFQAGGTVNAITLTPVSGASGVVIPADYDNIEGAVITFVPSGANTGAVTVSIGQTSGTQLATKKLLDSSGSALTGGELSATRIEAYYDPTADSSAGAWLLTPWSTGASSSVFTESFTSANQTITSAGALTIAHGLSSIPKIIQVYLECQSAELGYSSSDLVLVGNHHTQDGTASQGVSIVPDSTNLNVRYGQTSSAFNLIRKDTGVSASITNGNWQMIVKAYA